MLFTSRGSPSRRSYDVAHVRSGPDLHPNAEQPVTRLRRKLARRAEIYSRPACAAGRPFDRPDFEDDKIKLVSVVRDARTEEIVIFRRSAGHALVDHQPDNSAAGFGAKEIAKLRQTKTVGRIQENTSPGGVMGIDTNMQVESAAEFRLNLLSRKRTSRRRTASLGQQRPRL